MSEETLWKKWLRHYKSGGVTYAVYRGVKYLIWRVKKTKLDR